MVRSISVYETGLRIERERERRRERERKRESKSDEIRETFLPNL